MVLEKIRSFLVGNKALVQDDTGMRLHESEMSALLDSAPKNIQDKAGELFKASYEAAVEFAPPEEARDFAIYTTSSYLRLARRLGR